MFRMFRPASSQGPRARLNRGLYLNIKDGLKKTSSIIKYSSVILIKSGSVFEKSRIRFTETSDPDPVYLMQRIQTKAKSVPDPS